MATPNNITATNCSWWPISALENDAGKSMEVEANKDPTHPAFRSKDRLVLYHWTQSFSSQKVRLVIAEKGLPCEERDVSMPLTEHKEPWFMRLNLGEEVPVIIHADNIISDYNQIIDYMEKNFTGEHVVQLIPENGSLLHSRVMQYRELLDSLPMDAYTHGCILHPELTMDSMIPKYATAEIRRQKCELWLCGCAFTLADVLLGATLHRLKFLGLSKKYWEDGSRPNLLNFFERIQKRFAFRKVLGDIHTTLLSAVVPNAFRLVKRKPPSFFGASFLMGSLGGMGYFAYWYLKKKYI
ncbi:ganglioside-induced differentiation-associated protein 1-like 1 isoform X4 [Protobothrops mucrosquamatus]|uniref:ganglioside-induced differentiation-associated protein 1-like 1 isoform X4 n=1 Tax=Protobothrops mucrosquamatus TaxID=103944 RepID=UPI000775BABE|nr:ganglioside-induced differentiation-associated protein 1-like 1 isoform X4 [Protobothrops mucrosquamatus]